MALPVERLNDKFEGEFTFRGRRYGVPFTLPGDHVQFQLERKGRRRNSMKVVKIERADSYPDSLPLSAPFCEHHGRCGGCRAQHLDYQYQLTLKTEPVRAKMIEKFGVTPAVLPAPARRHFRGRMDFAVAPNAVGLRPAGDFASFVDIAECPVQSEAANAVLEVFRRVLAKHPGVAFDRETETGVLKYITIRSGHESTLAALTIESERREDPDYLRFRADLCDTLPDGFPLIETYSVSPSDVSCTPDGTTVRGEGFFTARLGRRDFRVPYDAFFQPNPAAFDVLLDWCFAALDECFEADGSVLIDLYAGMGVLSSLLVHRYPDRFRAVRGFDFTPSAVQRAPDFFPEETALDFRALDLNRPGPDLFAGENPASLIVIDPPRAGLSPNLARLIAEKKPAPLILYISCNPRTQLRDLDEFLFASYRPLDACIADCFPFTPHLEQAILLERRTS